MRKVLIANRGEIAVRVIRACVDEGIRSIAVYSAPDADSLHVSLADEAYALGGSSGAESYLSIPKLLDAVRRSGADAVHPGYGFLSENADFAQAVLDEGVAWIGPPPEAIRILGDKMSAREIAVRVGAPLVPGSEGPVPDGEAAKAFAEEHGLPIAIKAVFGGGGRGLKIAYRMEDVVDAFESASREALVAFGRGECFVEKFLERPRHVEAQILADRHGAVAMVGTRDCSLQRRSQKLVEEAPAPFLSEEQLATITNSAKAICRAAGYRGAGTVEYLVAQDGTISFLEVNTRLQVEHPVTEVTSGIDLVREQFRIAAGLPLSFSGDPVARGHAFEFRINAEDPARGFLPSPGRVEAFESPTGPGLRMDSGIRSGSLISGYYDSLLAKLIVVGEDRQQALRRARLALREIVVRGLPTVLPFHQAVVDAPEFAAEERFGVHTTWIEDEFVSVLVASLEIARSVPDIARSTLTVEIDGKAVQLGLPSHLYEALMSGTRSASFAGGPASSEESAMDEPGSVRTPMAGSLVAWLVEDGVVVREGDPVAMIEAMKMETPVISPKDGVLRRGKASPGDVIEGGSELARVE